MKLTIIAMATAAIIMPGTAQQLTRPQALKLLKAHKYEPANSVSFHVGEKIFCYEKDVESMKPLVKAGWLNLQILAQQNYGRIISASLTDKGTEQSKSWTRIPREVTGGAFDEWKVPLATREISEVTGIRTPMPSYAEVEYTWRASPTKTGQLLGIALTEPESDKAVFVRYDDGWRMKE